MPVIGAVVHPKEPRLEWVDLDPAGSAAGHIQLPLMSVHDGDSRIPSCLASADRDLPDFSIRLTFSQEPVIDEPFLG